MTEPTQQDRDAAEAPDEDFSRAYERGMPMWFSSEEDGGPDCGQGYGLGAVQLFAGERGGEDGWVIGLYRREQNDFLPIGRCGDQYAFAELLDAIAGALHAERSAAEEAARERIARELSDRATGLRKCAEEHIRMAVHAESLGRLTNGKDTARKLQEQAVGLAIGADLVRALKTGGQG